MQKEAKALVLDRDPAILAVFVWRGPTRTATLPSTVNNPSNGSVEREPLTTEGEDYGRPTCRGEDRWLSVEEIAAYLGVNRDTIYK